jgi:hypothetical protein
MEIELSKEFVITSDANQYILNKKYKKGKLESLGFYPSLTQLLINYIEYRCRIKEDIKTAQQLIDYQNKLITNLNKALKPLKFEVIQQDE